LTVCPSVPPKLSEIAFAIASPSRVTGRAVLLIRSWSLRSEVSSLVGVGEIARVLEGIATFLAACSKFAADQGPVRQLAPSA
jgi:hypothetical protein